MSRSWKVNFFPFESRYERWMGELGERRWSLCCKTYTPYFHASPQWRLPFPLQASPYFTYPFVSLFFTSLHPLLYLFLFPIIHLFFTHLSHLTHPQYHRRERGGERTAVAKQLAWPTRCGEANKEEEGHDDGGGDKGTRKERRGEERRGEEMEDGWWEGGRGGGRVRQWSPLTDCRSRSGQSIAAGAWPQLTSINQTHEGKVIHYRAIWESNKKRRKNSVRVKKNQREQRRNKKWKLKKSLSWGLRLQSVS